MADDDYSYYDSLAAGERQIPLSGNPPYDSNPVSSFGWEGNVTQASVFAATPPDFRTIRNRNASQQRNGSNQNFVESYWKNNHPVTSKKEWNTVRAQLAHIAPQTASIRIKNAVFQSVTNTLANCEGTWTDKADLFASLFHDIVPAATMQATIAISDLDRYDSNVFTFTDLELLDANFTTLANGAGADWPNGTRTNARYFRFTLTIDPQQADTGDLAVEANGLPSEQATTVYVRALREHDTLIAPFTKQLLMANPKILETIHRANNIPFHPAQKTHYESATNPETHHKWHNNVKAKARYYSMIQLVRTFYVGQLEGTESMAQRLQRIKQRSYNAETKQVRHKPVTELAADFQYVLAEVTPSTQHDELPNLENLVYQALSTDLQTELVQVLHAAPPTNVNQNLAYFNLFITQATTEEKRLRTVAGIAERAVIRSRSAYQPRNAGPGRGPRTFYNIEPPPPRFNHSDMFTLPPQPAQAHLDNMEQRAEAHSQRFDHSDIYHNVPIQTFSSQATVPTRNPQEPVTLPFAFICTANSNCTRTQQAMMAHAITSMDTMAEALCAVSIVEEALQKASGMRAPVRCFGCDGLPEYSSTCFHMWRDCPNKNDKRVWENFQNNLTAWREKRKNSNQQQSRYQANWRGQGYSNQTTPTTIAAIASPATSSAVRKVLLATLAKDLEDEYDTTNTGPVTRASKKKRAKELDTGEGPIHFLLYMQNTSDAKPRTFLGAPPYQKYPFKIAFQLPHMTFPIGDGNTSNDKAMLTGLLDTGGCCNMGSLQYHSEIMTHFPQLVSEFTVLEEKRYETINIGGLQGGVELTHIIVYHIPYTEKGQNCSITFGLTDALPLDTLFGVGFQIEAKMTIDLAGKLVYSGLFQEHYSLEFKAPMKTNPQHVVSQTDHSPKALVTQQQA
jgi:hypothetical protein